MKYQIIYADPPWNLKYIKETKAGINTYDVPYKTMSINDICSLPIKDISHEDSILFLWVTDNFVDKIQTVMNSWGFRYITVGFVWNKVAKTTNGVNATLSKYTRKSCEFCYIGTKGKYLVQNSCKADQYIGIPKERHSKKPECIKDRIVTLVGDLPRIELFAREKTPGWDVWGNEVESDIDLNQPQVKERRV